MLDLSSSQPFQDPLFLQQHQTVNEKNWFEYFKNHHEFDQNCLNIQKNLLGTLSSEEDFIREEITGIVYLYQKIDSKLFLIKKVDVYGPGASVLKVYVVINNLIFSGVHLKTLLSVKVANISHSLGGMVDSLIDSDEFSEDED